MARGIEDKAVLINNLKMLIGYTEKPNRCDQCIFSSRICQQIILGWEIYALEILTYRSLLRNMLPAIIG